MILIKNAVLWTMEELNNVKGSVLIDGKKIVEVSTDDLSKKYNDAEIIDAKEGILMPGIVDPHCHIGMQEAAIGWAGNDVNEITDPITPQMRAIDAIKVNDEAFLEALKAGITTVCTGPGSANIIGGTFCALKTKGKTIDEMIIKDEIAMKMALGENPKRCYQDKSIQTRMASAAIMRDALQQAKDYKTTLDNYNSNPEGKTKPQFNQKWDSLKRVFEGMPVKIHAHQADDIVTAIRISEEFNLNSTIEHATEGYLIADYLKKHNKSVIIGPLLVSKSKYEVKARTFKSAKVLHDSNVPFAVMTDHPVIPIENTLVQTGLLVKNGLDYLEALKANTINAAKIIGLDSCVGSIKPGKDADIVIYNKDPLMYDSKITLVMLNGNVEINNLDEE